MRQLVALLLGVQLLHPGFCFDASGCGVSKTCIRSVNDCDVTAATCLYFSFAWNSGSGGFDMEISGGTGAGGQYVAVAFSPDGLMRNSDLYYCTGTELNSGAIQAQWNPPVIDTSLPAGISNTNAMTTGGVGRCSFTRAGSITKQISGGTNHDFDLINNDYYVLLAVGSYSGGNIQQHTNSNRFPSPSAVDFGSSVVMATTQEMTTSMSTSSEAPMTSDTSTAATMMSSMSTSAVMTSSMTSSTEATMDYLSLCGSSVGCYRNPSTCTPGSSDCMFASWRYNSTDDAFDFVIVGGTGNVRQYASIAFGSTRTMKDADMYYCTEGAFVSGVIRELQQPPTNIASQMEISNTRFGVENGVLTCAFKRSASLTKTVSGSREMTFDLGTSSYYLLYAVGETSEAGALLYHERSGRSVSQDLINFRSSAASLREDNLVKITMLTLGFIMMMTSIF